MNRADGPFDIAAVEQAIRQILTAIGEDPDRQGLRDTPNRVARMYQDMFAGLAIDPGKHLDVTFYEQYDLDFRGGDNLVTRMTLTRKLPRWYLGMSVVFDRNGEGDDVGLYLMLWPEGAPEVKIGSGRRGYMQSSELN